MSTATQSAKKREDARRVKFNPSNAPGPDRPYSAKRDKAVTAGRPIPDDGVEWIDKYTPVSSKETQLAVLDAEKAAMWTGNEHPGWTPEFFVRLCEKTFEAELPERPCIMEPFEVFARRLLKACFVGDYREALFTSIDFDRWDRAKRWHSVFTVMDKRRDGYWDKQIKAPKHIDAPAPAVKPQQLQAASEINATTSPKLAASQDREDLLDKAAEARWKVKPTRINELFEAIQVAIAHPLKVEAQELTDGFVIVKNPHVWKLTHVALDRQPVIATRLDEKADFRDVTRRSDVRECLVALREAVEISRVKRGIKPPKPPKNGGNGNGGPMPISAAVKVYAEREKANREWNQVKIGNEVVQGL